MILKVKGPCIEQKLYRMSCRVSTLFLSLISWILNSLGDLLYWNCYLKLEVKGFGGLLELYPWDFLEVCWDACIKVLVTYSTWLVASLLVHWKILVIESYLTGPGLCRSYLQHLSHYKPCSESQLAYIEIVYFDSLWNPDTNSSGSLINILFEALAYRFKLPGLLAWRVSCLELIYTSTSAASVSTLHPLPCQKLL